MWAMMPMFLIFSIGTVRAINKSYVAKLTTSLPAIVRESLVRLRHSMNVVLFLNRPTAHVRGVGQLVGQFVRHAFVRPAASILQNPADRQAHAAILRHFHRNLVVGSAH